MNNKTKTYLMLILPLLALIALFTNRIKINLLYNKPIITNKTIIITEQIEEKATKNSKINYIDEKGLELGGNWKSR